MLEYKPKMSKSNFNVTEHSHGKRFLKFIGAIFLLSVLVLFALNFIAGVIANKIPPKLEQSLYANFKWSSLHGGETMKDEKEGPRKLIKDLVARLDSHIPKTEDSYKVSSDLVCMKMANAFAAAGGRIYVTSGLFRTVRSENGLAFILAHELGHVYLRHNSKSLISGLLKGFFVGLMGGGNSQEYFELLSGFSDLQFDRDAERQADEFAVNLVLKEYGHLGGSDEMFVGLQEEMAGKEDFLEKYPIFSTHPATQDRIDFIRKRLPNGEYDIRSMPEEFNTVNSYCQNLEK